MSKKIHILYTIPNFDTAGSGKVVYDLVKQLDMSRFKVSIACNHNKGMFFQEIDSLGVPIHLINITVPLRPYQTLVSRVKPYKDLLKREQIDLVHSWHWSSDWSEPLACKLLGIPFVYTKKSMGWNNKHWYIRSYLSKYIITVNTDMLKFFPFKRSQKLIPFGLDLNFYNPELFNTSHDESVFKLVTIANLVSVKNIEFLIQAIQSLKHLPIQLSIVGDTREAYAQSLKNLVTALQLETHVQFLGKQADVRAILCASDLYVISSRQEGMPMALVEAMAMAIPVLGANVPGIRYVLQDFKDLLFDLQDLDSLVTKILLIYHKSKDSREKLGHNLRAYCLEHYSMDTFINEHENLYLKLTNA